MNILEIKGLRKDFYLHHAQREIHSCENINFALEQGQFIGIVGRSGAFGHACLMATTLTN